jgi:nicotinamidase/pyrazinamidase
MKNTRALLVIDLQYDFCPGGALAVPDGDKIIPVVNMLLAKFDLVIFTKDWHPENMNAFASNHPGKLSFDKYITSDGKEDTLWPSHCVADTPGARLHEKIDFGRISGEFYIFKKGTEKNYHPYSGFGGTDLEKFLREKGIEDVFITGLATDYCVKDTALDASKFGFNTVVVIDGCRAIAEDIEPTLQGFFKAGIEVVESWELKMYDLL